MMPYPADLPVEALRLFLSKLKGGDVPFSTLLHASWVLQGFALGRILPSTFASPGRVLSKDELIEVLEKCDQTPVGWLPVELPWRQIAISVIHYLHEWFCDLH